MFFTKFPTQMPRPTYDPPTEISILYIQTHNDYFRFRNYSSWPKKNLDLAHMVMTNLYNFRLLVNQCELWYEFSLDSIYCSYSINLQLQEESANDKIFDTQRSKFLCLFMAAGLKGMVSKNTNDSQNNLSWRHRSRMQLFLLPKQ